MPRGFRLRLTGGMLLIMRTASLSTPTIVLIVGSMGLGGQLVVVRRTDTRRRPGRHPRHRQPLDA